MFSLIAKIAAAFCFLIALLISVGTFNGNDRGWVAGGLLALAIAAVLEGPIPPRPTQ